MANRNKNEHEEDDEERRRWYRQRINEINQERNRAFPHGNPYTAQGRRDYDPEWERTRQWRRDADRYEYGQVRHGQGANRDYEYGLGRNPKEEAAYRRSYRGPGWRRSGYSRDYGPDYGEHSERGYYPGGAYPTAGMRSDYGGRTEYDAQNEYDEEINYGEGDVGYVNEGAFYQDLDEPINYQSQDYEYGTGQLRGIGPRGYERSDERIAEDVNEFLTRNGRVDARNIEVDVQNGKVFLKGSVPNRQMKWIAGDIAEGIFGVKDVYNDIRVEGRDRRRRNLENRAENSPAGQTNEGAGLTSEGATSYTGMEAVEKVEESHRK